MHAESAPRAGAGRALPLVLGVASALWLALALYRHRVFGSAMLDLGLFDQIVWNTAHGRWFQCSVHRAHFLGDHFGPALALLAPAYRVVSSVDVLICANALAVVAAAIPLHAAVRARGGSSRFATLFVVVFLAFPSATAIAVYDFHPDVMALPWLMAALYFESERRYLPMVVVALVALAWKEEYAVWVATLGAFVALTHDTRRARGLGGALAAFGAAYLVVVVRWVMPHYNPGGMLQLVRYAYLRDAGSRPWVVFQEITPIKIAHLALAFIALALLPLRAPARLVLAVPVWGYSLLSTFENQAFLHYQNVVPILPPLVFSTLDALLPARFPLRLPCWLAPRDIGGALRDRRTRRLLVLSPLNVALALGAQWWLWGRHAGPTADAVARATAGLAPDASVSTTNALGAHFSERVGLVLYPRLVPIGAKRSVDDVILPLGNEGYRYSADGEQQFATEIEATRRAGYVPVAISGDVVRLERVQLASARSGVLDRRLDGMLGLMETGQAVPRRTAQEEEGRAARAVTGLAESVSYR